MKDSTITIGWLYPELMSTYGDRGNIFALRKRCEWRGIKTEILPIEQTTASKQLATIDLLFGGGAQDREQSIVMDDLRKKREDIKKMIDRDIPALFVCGAPQLMGNYYEPAEGQKIEGLGIFDMVSKHPGPDQPRLIGNTVAEVYWENLTSQHVSLATKAIVGFENHGGRTYLGDNAKPFAKILKGFGNNGNDTTEGVVYRNAIGCYFHGPLLPKNPEIADWLLATTLRVKYDKEVTLSSLDDELENKARITIAKRLGVTL